MEMTSYGPYPGSKVGQSSKNPLGSMNSPFTAGIWNKPRVFQERTNSPVAGISTQSAPPPAGPPEMKVTPAEPPPVIIPIRANSMLLHSQTPMSMPRLQRYSIAEENLASRLQQCKSGPSPRELQIRTLEKATAMLRAHAQDSRKRADKLRGMLADRSMDPKDYEQLKQERWMEERRQQAVDLDTKTALKQLQSLLDHPEDQSSHFGAPASHESRITRQRRRHLNLVKFLQSPPPVPVSKSPLVFPERALRKRILNRVSSMHLRTVPPTNASFGPTKGHLRSHSLDRRERESQLATESKNAGASESDQIPPRSITEDLDLTGDTSSISARSFASSSQSTPPHSLWMSPTPSTVFIPEVLDPTDPSSPVESHISSEKGDGIAIIYRPQSPHSLTINSEDIEVQIPDYALDLFSRFDSNYEVLQPLFPSSPAPQSTTRPPSRFIPFPSFRSPSKQSNRSSSPTVPSLNSPFSSPKKSNKSTLSPELRTQRHLGSLFAIPEALSTEKISGNGILSRPRGGREDLSASATSLPKSVDTGEDKDALPAKARKRFSGLRLGRV